MTRMVAAAVLAGLTAYALAGMAVAAWLLAFGLRRVDPGAQAAPIRVKALWIPGMIAVWPALLMRAFGHTPPEDRA